MSLDHRGSAADAKLRRELGRLARQIVFGTIAERSRVCGKPACRCARGEKHPVVQLSYWAPEGQTRGHHVPRALVDPVRDGVAAWHRFQAIAREVADRNRARLWTRARRNGQIR